jgi:hypothetical protein
LQPVGFRIRSLWAWVTIDDDDDESIPGARLPTGDWLPLIGADEERLRSLRPRVEAIARQLGRPISLVRFTERELIEVLDPKQGE